MRSCRKYAQTDRDYDNCVPLRLGEIKRRGIREYRDVGANLGCGLAPQEMP
jgi:hypothetical protein